MPRFSIAKLRAEIETATALGQHFTAIETCEHALVHRPQDVWILQHYCLALCRCRLLSRAVEIYQDRLLHRLGSLTGHMRSEVHALGARLTKDLALETKTKNRRDLLLAAAQSYAEGWNTSSRQDRSYPAINAATLFALAGKQKESLHWANLAFKSAFKGTDYWSLATSAEALVLLGRFTEAKTYALRALRVAKGRMDHLASTVRNLGLMVPLFPQAAEIATIFTPPPVGWGGGLASTSPSLPENLRSAIVAITSPADLDFALRLAAKNIALDLLLPRDRESALAFRPKKASVQDINAVFSQANVLEGYGTGPITPTDVRHCVALARGLAMLRAQAFATTPQVIGCETKDIPRPHQPDSVRWVSAIFGDFKGFSKLDDESVARFTSVVLGLVATTLEPWRQDVLMVNTWGDGIFIVIEDTAAAAAASLCLCRAIRSLDLRAQKLPTTLGLRLGVHHTCATIAIDPLTQKKTVIGRGISTAARIEPITPEGRVYVTETFAAALATHPDSDAFTCDYVGLIPLAKGFGSMRMFQLNELEKKPPEYPKMHTTLPPPLTKSPSLYHPAPTDKTVCSLESGLGP